MRRPLRLARWMVLVVGVSIGATPVAAQQMALGGSLGRGAWDVGFRRLWHLDASRVWERSPALGDRDGVVARPIRIDLWYPARCGDRPPMAFATYVEVVPPADEFRDMSELLGAWDRRSYANLVGEQGLYDALMASPTGACLDPPPADGRYPLILYSAGWYSRSPDNVVLAEYLASHGFVVATIPQLNPGLWTFDFGSNPAAVETQIRDLEVAFGVVSREPFVDRTRAATAGYSKGGDVALLLQGRNALIKAVVGLDPSFALGSGEEVLAAPSFGLDLNRVPILALRRPFEERESRLPPVMDSLHFAQRLLVVVPDSDHGSFGDDPIILAHSEKGAPEAVAAHATTARIVLGFLRHTLGVDPRPLNSSDVDRLVDGGATARFDDAAPVPDTYGWEQLLVHEGFAETARRAADLRRAYPDLEIVREREVNALGYRRLRENRPHLAVALFRLNARLHPRSANTHDSLADGCLAIRDRDCVIGAYRELLRTLPSDGTLPPEVKDRMREKAERSLREARVPSGRSPRWRR